MTSATDRLVRARAELAAAEEMGVDTDAAVSEVELAEQDVVDEGGCPVCGCLNRECEACQEDCAPALDPRACPFCGGQGHVCPG